MKKTISATPHIFKPYWDDMMGDPPVYIKSAKQKKQELEKRKLEPRE